MKMKMKMEKNLDEHEYTVVFNCNVFLKVNKNESAADANARLKRILTDGGLDYTIENREVLDENGCEVDDLPDDIF